MINLDFLCMKTAQEIVGDGKANDKENVAIKGLGVLIENGPYGMILYLENLKNDTGVCYKKSLLGLCRGKQVSKYLKTKIQPPDDGNFQGTVMWLQELATDLDRYLFVKKLWQQTLTYAGYHAKAMKKTEESSSVEKQEKTQ